MTVEGSTLVASVSGEEEEEKMEEEEGRCFALRRPIQRRGEQLRHRNR
jgi:hypothetical protein